MAASGRHGLRRRRWVLGCRVRRDIPDICPHRLQWVRLTPLTATPGALHMKDPKQVSKESTLPSAVSQPVVAQLPPAAIFLVVTVHSGKHHARAVRALCVDLSALLHAEVLRALE